MLSALVTAIKTADLRKKILFTLAMVVLYRIGAQIPAPGVNYGAIHESLESTRESGSSVYQLIDLFSGGALLQLSVFAMGIMPYITASIIVQLLTVVIPRFEELKKEGQSGQNKMTQYTRYLTVALALLQSGGVVAMADSGNMLSLPFGEYALYRSDPEKSDLLVMITVILVMTAGAVLLMWMGELISERGLGNGMSLLIFAGIASRIPAEGASILRSAGGFKFSAVCGAALLIVVAVVFIEQGQRRIPVQYAKRMVGRKMYGGTSTYLPLKVNQAGVIPVIFASSLMFVPVLVTNLVSAAKEGEGSNWWQKNVMTWMTSPASWQYVVLYFALIIFFSYFYVAIQFDPKEQADNMKKYGGFIPGIRPGKPTADYLGYVLSRILVVGSIYLGTIAVLPNVFLDMGSDGGSQNLPFGGTAVLIMVSVGLDTLKQVESQIMQRKYEGFLK